MKMKFFYNGFAVLIHFSEPNEVGEVLNKPEANCS
jgi:hypothetical protein